MMGGMKACIEELVSAPPCDIVVLGMHVYVSNWC